ncbi:nuclear pore complex protein Nup214 [Phlebotomus argentipes]|uniref:nuclear pore complex protein Nup214 n=1 Tax=Phlebotomus argentipes TaxID=94469 RepID=UPI0028936156|nr:nuclear pore complex protein Nup214 [Phlebotomus argentipes]
MVEKAPDFIDVTEVQFKLQSKVKIFGADATVKPHCQLVATASAFGLVFVASPLPELKVVQLSALTGGKVVDENAPVRTIPLPSEATQIAVNCDNTILAVDVVVNGITMILLYVVQTFLSQNVRTLQSIRLSPDTGVRSKQLAWNPAISNVLAVCLENGALSMFVLKEQGFEFHTVDKAQTISSVCWSPKGKQIVAGCPNGKLIQYKPDLKPIRVIDCPLDTQAGPLLAISIQWLSTYQFAVAFAALNEPAPPVLYVVNAPKSGQISCINYEDICYSGSGPRQTQVYLIHILPWNTLLMASANSMEVGVLATNEAGDAPVWRQWCMLDEARAELPLTAKKQESYPLGFCLETGCTHQVVVGEQEMPVMPMIHLLSTDGVLVSFNILNTIQNVPGICSPPRPLADTSGLGEFVSVTPQKQPPVQTPSPIAASVPAAVAKEPETPFAIPPAATSTPMVAQKAKGLFGTTEAFKAPSIFGNVAQQPVVSKPVASFGLSENVPKAGTPFVKPSAAPPTVTAPKAVAPSADQNKPLITVPPSYSAAQAEKKSVAKASNVIPLDDENNAVIQKMIMEEMQAFEKDLSDPMKRSQNIDTQIGSQETLSNMSKQLRELTELTVEGMESIESLSADVRILTMTLNEAFMMTEEAKSKWEVVTKPTYTNVNLHSGANLTNRRQLNKLQGMLTSNRIHLEEIKKQIDSVWVLHEEERKQQSKDRMRVPRMEVIYQTINIEREILMGQRKRLNEIRKKMNVKVNQKASVEDFDSLSDSVVSLALVEEVQADTRKLCASKMKRLSAVLKDREIRTIHPQRPERKGVNSVIVQERREAAAKAKTLQTATQQQQQQQQQSFPQFVKVVVDPKQVPPTRPVAKATPKASKPVVEPPKPAPVATKPSLGGGFEVGKPFAATVPSIFPPKSDGKSFIFTSTRTESEENKPPPPQQQQEIVFAPKPTAAIAAKPSVASPTVAALLTSKTTTGLSENAQQSQQSGDLNKTPPFAFNIQKSPLGVFNQGNKAAFAAPAIASSSPATSGGIFSQIAASTASSTASIFGGLSSFGSLTADGVKSEKPAASATPAQVLNLSFGGGSAGISTPMAALEASVLSTVSSAATSTVVPTTVVKKEIVEVPKKVDSGFKFVLPGVKDTIVTTTIVPTIISSAAATVATTIAKTTASVTTSSTAFDADNLLKNLSFCQPTTVAEKPADAKPFSVFSIGGFGSAATATTTAASIFGGSSATTVAAATTAAEPFKLQFGTATAAATTTTSTSPPSGLFSSVVKTEVQPFGAVSATTTVASPFASVTTTSATPFSFTPASTAAATVAATPFGASGGSIFGSTGFQAQPSESSSVFGAANANTTSIFGGGGGGVFGQTTAPASTGNVFGTPASPNSNSGSIFGGSTPTKSTSSVFGGSSVFGATPATPQAQTSIFGGDNAAAAASPGFGFGQQQPQQQPSSVFGSPSAFGRPFGSPSGGAFAQGGPSVAQTGFGSPTAFAKPQSAFGSSPTFGGPATFGSSPTFGGAATFGSSLKPSGFGSFANTGSSFANASSNQQQSNLFATLGSSDTGMTFGNLAQNNNANQAKMQFGGSAFSTWRQ